MFKHIIGLFTHPKQEWEKIRDAKYTIKQIYLQYYIFIAAIPAVCLYFGVTEFGWSIAGLEFSKIDPASALPLAVLFYFTLLIGLAVMSYMLRWMRGTYGSEARRGNFCGLTAFSATPLILFSIILLYPLVWLDVLIGLVAVAYAVYIFYIGMPIMAGINDSKSFLFSTAVVTLWLCALVVMLVAAVFAVTLFPPEIVR